MSGNVSREFITLKYTFSLPCLHSTIPLDILGAIERGDTISGGAWCSGRDMAASERIFSC